MIRLLNYLFVVNLFFFMSCKQSDNVRLEIPETIMSIAEDQPLKMLVYYDSIGCFDCKMKEFLSWEGMLNYFEKNHQECPIFFVISPNVADSAKIFSYLSDYSTFGNITMDHDYVFARNNPILHDSRYRGLNYVVDSDNTIRLMGRFLRDRKDLQRCESFIVRYVK